MLNTTIKMEKMIYLDNASTTKVDDSVARRVQEFLLVNSVFLEMRFNRIKFVVIQASRTEFDVNSPTTGQEVTRIRLENFGFSLSYLFSF